MRRQIDNSILEMALVGYEAERQKIEAKISELRKQLGVRGRSVAAPIRTNGATPKRVLSPAARKRIAAAQKKRWAAFHAKQKGTINPAPKRNMSAERKAASCVPDDRAQRRRGPGEDVHVEAAGSGLF